MILYFISKRKREGGSFKYLAWNQKSFVSLNPNKKLAAMTDQEAEEFIRKHEQDPKHYYFKTVKFQTNGKENNL